MNFTIEAPKRKTIVMVFDVETSGLLPKKDKSNPLPLSIDSYPHILQLSYALYNISTNKLIETYDTYIKVKRDVEISEKITELRMLTLEINKLFKKSGENSSLKFVIKEDFKNKFNPNWTLFPSSFAILNNHADPYHGAQ